MTEVGRLCCLQLSAAWVVMLVGILWGMAMGLFFHKAEWMGGYGSWRRRLLRLGHISCFGLGILNILHVVTLILVSVLRGIDLENRFPSLVTTGSGAWLVALFTMPVVCALSAWREPLRRFFIVPVVSSMVGITITACLSIVGGLS